MPIKKIYVFLSGGLGNQMFQYGMARALALQNGAELVLDTWSGFVRDYQYHRNYELQCFPIRARIATPLERMRIWIFRLENKLRGSSQEIVQRKIYGNFIIENGLYFLGGIKSATNYMDTFWLVGYWQSPRYFQDYIQTICAELMPPKPLKRQYIELGSTLRETESVALGIRLYEESLDPAAHAKGGLTKKVLDVQAAITKMIAKHPNAIFYVFCTHRAQFLSELNLPSSTVFVTHDDGYIGTVERLWLLAQCRHHIFTNSSYYWWGAQLSQSAYLSSDRPQSILAADNFTNEDTLYPEWEIF